MATSSPYVTSLATKSASPGGIGVAEAILAAQRNLDDMHERILAEIDTQLMHIRQLASMLEHEDADTSLEIVRAADMLTGLCASTELRPIGDAARGLCKLYDAINGQLPADIVRLSVDTMRLLREQGGAQRQQLWADLRSGVEAALDVAARKRGLLPD